MSWISAQLLLACVIMSFMAYCELCELDREFCPHGLAQRRRVAAAIADRVLISPNGVAFPEVPATKICEVSR